MKELLIFLLVLFFIESKIHVKSPNAKTTKITNKELYKNSIESSNEKSIRNPIKIPIAKPMEEPRNIKFQRPIAKLRNKYFERLEIFPKLIRERIKKTTKIVSCIGGRVIGGFCYCPKGYKKYNGNCLNSDTIKAVKCQGGIVFGKRCKCPQKKKLINGICVSIYTLHKEILLNLKN